MIELLLSYLMHCTPWPECDIEPPKVQQVELYKGIPKTRSKRAKCLAEEGNKWDYKNKVCIYK